MVTVKVKGLQSRRIALSIMDAVVNRAENFDNVFEHLSKDMDLHSDKAFIYKLCATTLRWMTAYDRLIDSAMKKPLSYDAKARMVLRLALVQFYHLDTPAHAIIATALPLLYGGPKRLAHGVFSAIIKAHPDRMSALPDYPPLPPGVVGRWSAFLQDEDMAACERAWTQPPPIDLHFHNEERWRDFLSDEPRAFTLLPLQARVAAGVDVTTLPGFGEGHFWVQDVAASIPVRMLGAGKGRKVLDLCAAPGGKTMQLAASGWKVDAIDSDTKRLESLEANLQRTGLCANIIQRDILDWAPDREYDLVLLDAPCSATGIYRRHPDVLYRVGARSIENAAATQAAMLKRAAHWVKPGGVLAYIICSMEQKEGEEQVEKFLASRPQFHWLIGEDRPTSPLDKFYRPAGGEGDVIRGGVRTRAPILESEGGLDAFYIALLKRGE